MAEGAFAPASADSQREFWKPVPSFPGLLASNKGRILLPPRYSPIHHGGFRGYFPKPTYGFVTRAKKSAAHSYRGIYNSFFGNIKVHRAVCEAFHGPSPTPDAVVIHIDEDAHNNRPENLKWGTQKENLNMPKFKDWLRSPGRGAKIAAGKSAKRGAA